MDADAPIGPPVRKVSSLRIYLLGLALNLVYLAVLLSFDVSRRNLQPISLPEAPTVWRFSDAGTYVRSARAFLATGVFAGSDGLPDAHRTVGYPAFLAGVMAAGGANWVPWIWILQAVLFAFIYPALAFVAREWFSATNRQTGMLLLVYALIGAGWAYTPIPLTDQMFAVCLWGALALGTRAVRRGGIGSWLGHFALLGAAASIRPTLALFPLAFAALMFALRGQQPLRRLAVVFAVQMLLCQAPALRNYVHHGVYIPSDVMVMNLSDYLAKNVLAFTGQPDTHAQAEPDWKERPLKERLAAQTEFAQTALTAHPFVAAGVLAVNLGLNTLETHWIQPMHFFRSSLHCDLKRWGVLSPGLKVFHAFWALIHAGLALAACCGLWQLVRQRRWAFLLFVLVFTLPYLYGATDAQGARFRLYLEGLILMLALLACPKGAEDRA
jgi:hypothetical protein